MYDRYLHRKLHIRTIQERNFWVAYSAEGRQVDDANGQKSAGRSHSLSSSSEATENFRDIVDAVIRKRKYALCRQLTYYQRILEKIIIVIEIFGNLARDTG